VWTPSGPDVVWILEKKMAWVFAQVFLAFALAVFIVWWTIPKSKKPKPPESTPQKSDENNG